MIIRHMCVRLGALILACGMVFGTVPLDAEPWRCRAEPVEPCFTHRGRLTSQNGIPLKIWLIGTTRVVSVENDHEDIPAAVRKYLEITSEDHSYVYGDFEICPLAPDTPGHMRPVCVTAASRMVIQNRRRERPPFRLLATWPPAERPGTTGPDMNSTEP